jgi:hypothetical protein
VGSVSILAQISCKKGEFYGFDILLVCFEFFRTDLPTDRPEYGGVLWRVNLGLALKLREAACVHVPVNRVSGVFR